MDNKTQRSIDDLKYLDLAVHTKSNAKENNGLFEALDLSRYSQSVVRDDVESLHGAQNKDAANYTGEKKDAFTDTEEEEKNMQQSIEKKKS